MGLITNSERDPSSKHVRSSEAKQLIVIYMALNESDALDST